MEPTEVDDATRAWVARWQAAGPLLERERRAALAALTPAEGRAAAYDMLAWGSRLPPDPARERWSGFVEMRRLFARVRD